MKVLNVRQTLDFLISEYKYLKLCKYNNIDPYASTMALKRELKRLENLNKQS